MNIPEKIYLFESRSSDNLASKWLPQRLEDTDIEYTRTDALIEKAEIAFCKAVCNGKPPRDTCTSLGTCNEYDDFRKAIKG